MPITWVIFTGEYPPQPGGVSDYTWQVARGLVEAGDSVHVFAPPVDPSVEHAAEDPSVRVHRLTSNFGPSAIGHVRAELRNIVGPRRILVQYVPHAFGYRAMNVRFARWLRQLARGGESVNVMFHEVAYPLEAGQALKHRLLAVVNRRMAKWIGQSADRLFISSQGWEGLLREIGVKRPVQWLPVPSNLTQTPDPAAVAAVRAEFGSGPLIAHFGTYGQRMTALEGTLQLLAERDPNRTLLLLGRGGLEFAEGLIASHPTLAGRIRATGPLDSAAVAAHLAACDLMIQPYPDGISCRRSTAMAGLALGVPVVTCSGSWTESIWSESGAVALAPSPAAADVAAMAESLLSDLPKMRLLGARGRDLYNSRFDVSHTIRALRILHSQS
jgi:glycosyltransferase involved in cell wall biosynthesis